MSDKEDKEMEKILNELEGLHVRHMTLDEIMEQYPLTEEQIRQIKIYQKMSGPFNKQEHGK